MRALIQSAVPDASDAWSYRIPAFRIHGRILVWYAAWQHHISLYPITTPIQRKFAADIKGYKTAKGTIQFPLIHPVPASLVRKLVAARLAELGDATKVRTKTRKVAR